MALSHDDSAINIIQVIIINLIYKLPNVTLGKVALVLNGSTD